MDITIEVGGNTLLVCGVISIFYDANVVRIDRDEAVDGEVAVEDGVTVYQGYKKSGRKIIAM